MNGRVSSFLVNFPGRFSRRLFSAPSKGPLFFRPISFTRKLFTHVSRVGKFSLTSYNEIRVAARCFPAAVWKYENIMKHSHLCEYFIRPLYGGVFEFACFFYFVHLFILHFCVLLLLYKLDTFCMSRVCFVWKKCRFEYCLSNIQSLISHIKFRFLYADLKKF